MSVKLGIDVELHQLSMLAPAGYSIGLHIRFTAPLFMFQTYDQAWLDHYTERGYVLRDPMVAWGFSTTGTIRWSDSSLPDPFGLFNEARDFGLNFGATVACGPIKSRTIASFAHLTASSRMMRLPPLLPLCTGCMTPPNRPKS